jgi:hypothetical protein
MTITPDHLAADMAREEKRSLRSQKPRIYESHDPSQWRYWDWRNQPASLLKPPRWYRRIEWGLLGTLLGAYALGGLTAGLLWLVIKLLAAIWRAL